MIEEVKAIDGVDSFPGSGEADFFAQNIRIDGHGFPATAIIDDQDTIAPHWRFGHTPSLSGRTTFPVDIEIWDEDTFDDEKIDLFSSDGRKLRLFVTFDGERCGISAIHSDGDIGGGFSELVSVGYWKDGVCRIDRTDRGNEDARAEITYSIQLLTVPTARLIPLYGWYDPIRGDNFATSDINWYGRSGDRRSPNYRFVRIEGYIYNPLLPQPVDVETLPLQSWWSPSREDNFATTHPSWVWNPDEMVSPDYKYVRLEGYVLSEPKSDSLELHGWWSPGREDNFATTHPSWVWNPDEMVSPDYKYVRLEGYLLGDPTPDPMVIWHAWQGEDKALLTQLGEGYGPAAVQLVDFASDAALLQALRQAGGESAPDLFLGPDLWAKELLDLQLIDAYCLPGQCPQCTGQNPPPWCPYAGGEFAASAHPGLDIAGLCTGEGDCGPCSSPNPPRWCWAAQLARVQSIDLFQALFSRTIEGEGFPIGIPIGWDTSLVLINPAWFVENKVAAPRSIDEILTLVEQHPGNVYLDPNFDPSSTQVGRLIDALKGEPNPQTSLAALLLVPFEQLPNLNIDGNPLFLLPLSDYQPQPVVHGIYLNTNRVKANQDRLGTALDLAYLITDEETQLARFQQNRHLPTHGAAWTAIADKQTVDLTQQWLLSLLGTLPVLPDFRMQPTVPPPDFGDDACGQAAQQLYEQLTDIPGITTHQLAVREAEVRFFVESCRRIMPDFGSGRCARQAQAVYAHRRATSRGTPNALGSARVAAELAYGTCQRLSNAVTIFPDVGGTLTHMISNTLHARINVPIGASANPLELSIQEGADPLEMPDGTDIVGSMFVVNAFDVTEQASVTLFSKPLQLVVDFGRLDLQSHDLDDLMLVYWDDGREQWVEIPSTIDRTAQTAIAELDHLTTLGLRIHTAEGSTVYLPLVLR